jgi:hypothetical protein
LNVVNRQSHQDEQGNAHSQLYSLLDADVVLFKGEAGIQAAVDAFHRRASFVACFLARISAFSDSANHPG